jgi:transposase
MALVEELRARLGQNSSNSNRPPSTDSPSDRQERPKKLPSGRPHGAQPGHKPAKRELLPPEKVKRFHVLWPHRCHRCKRRLPHVRHGEPLRHQVLELPSIEPDVDEFQHQHVLCTCGAVTCAALPDGVPRGMLGPRLLALIGYMTGRLHVARRSVVEFLGDVLHTKLCLGTVSEAEEKVSEAIAAPVEEAFEHVAAAPVKHADATGWKQCGAARTLWTIATTMATVFAVTPDATLKGLRGLFKKIRGTLVSDRGSQFGFWAMEKRQICWAHLIRKFAAFSQRSGKVGEIGRNLLFLADMLMFCWHNARDGTTSRKELRRRVDKLSQYFEAWLEAGVRLDVRGFSGSCENLLAHREALWTFARQPGVEPTNNHAERELRAYVLWRKSSFGSQSERGDRYAERIMTVTHTLRKQRRNVLEYLTAACQAALRGTQPPSLLIAG